MELWIFEHRFGHLACFTSDVEKFLLVLSPDKKTKFLEKLMGNSSSLSTEPIKALGQSITLLKIQELIGNMYRLPVVGASLFYTYMHAHTDTLLYIIFS